eukprot:CAMPEP_0117424346 /NCGR_PEP_ID=MMETSP0758-20121206/4787_1 /TAXON_ID=63605 /ORGANISM="Percolomonas cosmopolitus, Strain AE-1 (ATCC 50343)" /LENGTH=43 /DNA_ID= /DNA_START= /DNA_END= /DNA_ORIENTATION=
MKQNFIFLVFLIILDLNARINTFKKKMMKKKKKKEKKRMMKRV